MRLFEIEYQQFLSVCEATVGRMYSPQIIGVLTVGEFKIPIHKHALERASERRVSGDKIDEILRKIATVGDKVKSQAPGAKFWIYDSENNIALGMLMLDSGAIQLNTVIKKKPYEQGVTDVINLLSERKRKRSRKKTRRSVYGPVPYGWYGYYYGGSGEGDSGGGDGGGGESILSPQATEDYDPNQRPPGPEFRPTMPAGTVRVDVSDVYDWYKLGQHISNLKGLGKHDFGQGPPSTIVSFGDEDTEHKYIKDLERTGLTTTDIDPPGGPKIKGQKKDPTYNVDEVAGAILKATDLVDVFIKGQHKGQTITKLVAKDFPNQKIPQLIQKLEKEHGINPGAVVYGLSKKVDENFADGKNPGRKGLAKRVGVNCKQPVSKLRSIAKNSSGERQRMAHWCANMKSGRNK
jgi:hypothetical protein